MTHSGVDAGFVISQFRDPDFPDYVVAELKHDSRVAPTGRGFGGAPEAADQVADLNEALSGFDVQRFRSHFGLKASSLQRRVVDAPSYHDQPVSSEFAHAGFVQIVPKSGKDAEPLVQRLNRNRTIWNAYVAPRPAPAQVPAGADSRSRNLEPSQGYLHSAPLGIGAMDVWGNEGGRGEGVSICDIEGNWHLIHEDLPGDIRRIGGTAIRDLGWRNHGTAVLGEMMSQPGPVGTVGVAHKARAAVQSPVINGVWNTAGAIRNATLKLDRGDVILIELQGVGPRGRYVAMQYWDDVYSAIRAATDRGITVVEAAGNGNEDFDLAVYRGSGLQRDAGAIVVGAGVPPTNFHDHDEAGKRYLKVGVPRSRIWFSNFGRIVTLQAWGWHVTTLGYGDAQGGRTQKRWYTLRFSGTSSASPIVAGAVACIQGRAKAVAGGPLEPKQLRELLLKTGTPQEAGPGVPLTQQIGPQPNLLAAFKKIR